MPKSSEMIVVITPTMRLLTSARVRWLPVSVENAARKLSRVMWLKKGVAS